ncbi:flagellin [Caproicibacterium sp. XB1]|uniref:flagellin N-terminal helical domain-containing protein n=1 Tax=Caproicibacterium sp. XB1 TaxID=3396405 RepID=UPI0039B6F679
MGMVVRTNTMAMNAQRMMNINNNKVASSLQKLSSGYKINSAADDAAGLAISEHMKAQIKDLDAAADNSNDGISVAQTAEGALNEVHDMLNRMSELATKAANGVYTDSQRSNYSDEVTQLQSEIDRVADSTNFNGIKLLDGTQAGPAVTTTAGTGDASTGTAATTAIDFTGLTGANAIGGTVTVGSTTYEFVKTGGTATTGNTAVEIADNADAGAIATAFATKASGSAATNVVTLTASDKGSDSVAPTVSSQNIGGMSLQIGDTNDSYNKLKVSISDMHASALGVDANSISISDQASAGKAISVINSAIDKVSKQRSQLGAIQNRLDHTINNLNTTSENLTSANSRIRDTDMAKEMMSYTQNNVLTQAAQAMLAQANQAPSQVLQLLK